MQTACNPCDPCCYHCKIIDHCSVLKCIYVLQLHPICVVPHARYVCVRYKAPIKGVS